MLRACGITQLLDAALAGFNVTIMTYGQTGSGKTFTMSGREDVLEMDDYNGDSLQANLYSPSSKQCSVTSKNDADHRSPVQGHAA